MDFAGRACEGRCIFLACQEDSLAVESLAIHTLFTLHGGVLLLAKISAWFVGKINKTTLGCGADDQ